MLPVTYTVNTHAWMMQALFENWLHKLDLEFKQANRHLLLIVDNCPARGAVEGLGATPLELLPPDATTALQLMDQGVIKCLKMAYQKLMLKRL